MDLIVTMIFQVVVARYRNLRPIRSIKHVVDTQGALAAGGNTDVVTLVNAIDSPSLGVTNSVEFASRISSLYLNVQVYATSEASLANVYMAIMKNPGNNLTTVSPNAVGASDNKKYVIHQEMRMMGGATTEIPITLFNGVIRIPKGYQRFGAQDQLQLIIQTPGNAIDYCSQAIYKELR